ncbi:MAG TPA: class I SAM-dependent methyltransferase [Bryobacteraceae bacterium]|nr:class I SAM-dependent methyltransferase [Bryobacteraceae bacterium]
MKAYARDLAYIHDKGYTSFVTRAAPGLLRLIQQHGVARGLVVDAGCGSGVWARILTDRGYAVLGIDISTAMLRLARLRAPAARFRAGSLFSLDLPTCDAVTSIGECVNYAFDPASGKPGLVHFFERVYRALRPGGVLVFDIVEPGAGNGAPSKRFMEGPDWSILLDVDEDRKHRTLTRRIVSFRQVGSLYRRSEETHRQHLYESTELLDELNRIGFETQLLGGYGRLRFAPAHAGILALKPE